MKMKNILNSLFPWLAVTTLLSLQGCENEEGTAIHSRDTVSFEIDAGGARATETTFETGDAIGVYAAVRMSSAPATRMSTSWRMRAPPPPSACVFRRNRERSRRSRDTRIPLP